MLGLLSLFSLGRLDEDVVKNESGDELRRCHLSCLQGESRDYSYVLLLEPVKTTAVATNAFSTVSTQFDAG